MTLRASAIAAAAVAALLAVPAVAYGQDTDLTPRAQVCAADTTFAVDTILAGFGDTGLPEDLTPLVGLIDLTDTGVALLPTASLEEVRVALLCDEVTPPVEPSTEPVEPSDTTEPTPSETPAPTTSPETTSPTAPTTTVPESTSVAIPDADGDGVTQVDVLPALPAQTGGGPA